MKNFKKLFKNLWIEIKHNKYYFMFHTIGDLFMILLLVGAFPFSSISEDTRIGLFIILSFVWLGLFLYLSANYKNIKELK